MFEIAANKFIPVLSSCSYYYNTVSAVRVCHGVGVAQFTNSVVVDHIAQRAGLARRRLNDPTLSRFSENEVDSRLSFQLEDLVVIFQHTLEPTYIQRAP